MACQRVTAHRPKTAVLSCTASALFLFATYHFLTSALHQNRTSGISLPNDLIPACEIWPGWRAAVPNSISANDSALSLLRLGISEVMSEVPDQGCTPAKERLGLFSHSSGEKHYDHPSWSTVRWGQLQSTCANKFYGSTDADPAMPQRKLVRCLDQTDDGGYWPTSGHRSTCRTAVVLRTWDAYQYSDNQLAWMRAVTTELSLDTGGRFQVFILVNVKDNSLNLFDDHIYAQTLQKSVPEEFRDLALLYNEAIIREWYPKVGEYGAQDQMYQALQIFSHSFPEFGFVWQLEMDARFTGNVAKMLTSAGNWARRQPRRNLWERNGQWFISALWKDYASFSARVDEEIGDSGIWGPHPYAKFYLDPQGPKPPKKRDDVWGIGEEAELITLAPLIDPVNTKWTYESTVHGFESPLYLPRRMAIVSMTRTSRHLLRLISQEQQKSGAWVVSESTPETWSLLHGLKAVYVPHLVAFNFETHAKTPEEQGKELDIMIHKGPAWNLAGGEHAGLLWCSDVGLPEHKWLSASYFYWAGDAPRLWWEYTNGSCTYPLVLHPVKSD